MDSNNQVQDVYLTYAVVGHFHFSKWQTESYFISFFYARNDKDEDMNKTPAAIRNRKSILNVALKLSIQGPEECASWVSLLIQMLGNFWSRRGKKGIT
jgi:hypothetical protein